MKNNKFLVLLVALAAAALLSSCTRKYYTIEEGVNLTHIDFTIRSSDWQVNNFTDDSGKANGAQNLWVKLDVPAITKDVVDYGTVMVSHKMYDNGKTVWTPLPAVRAEFVDYNTEDEYLYSAYLDYEWQEGCVYVYFTTTDFYIDESDVNTIEVRVTVIL